MSGFDHKGVFDQEPPALAQQGEVPEGTLEIKSEDGQFTILARVAVTPEDEQFIMNRYLNRLMHERRRMSIEKQARLLDSLWLELLIQQWDLPIPLKDKAKAIAQLSQADRDYLFKAIMAAQPAKPLREKQIGQKRLSSDVKQVIQSREKRFGMV